MAGAGGDEVRDEHGVEEDALRAEDHDFHEPAWFGHLEEREEVHALVIRFLQQRFNPPVIPLHPAQRMEMPEHACDHSWHPRNGFEEYHPD